MPHDLLYVMIQSSRASVVRMGENAEDVAGVNPDNSILAELALGGS
jgi:hypothetical protein